MVNLRENERKIKIKNIKNHFFLKIKKGWKSLVSSQMREKFFPYGVQLFPFLMQLQLHAKNKIKWLGHKEETIERIYI